MKSFLPISKRKIEHVQSKGINAFSSLDEIDQNFHFIISYGVIDEVLDPVDIVKKLGRMLEKGGILKICVVNGSWLPEKFNISLGRILYLKVINNKAPVNTRITDHSHFLYSDFH